MNPESNIHPHIDPSDLHGLVDSLDELDLESNLETVEAVEELSMQDIEEIEVEEFAELSAADEHAIEQAAETAAIREEVYASAPVSDVVDSVPTPAPEKMRKAKSASATKTPKIERDLSSLPDATFALTTGDEPNKSAVLALRPTQKKIAEKFENLFISLNAGRQPSVYTMVCYRAAKAAPGAIKMADLVAALQASGYSTGTARSQAGQIATLFT